MNQIGVCSKLETCVSTALRHLAWGARRTDWKSWTLLCFMLIPLRSNIAPPPTPAGLLSMTCDDHEDILFWNESISPAQVTLSVCVCLCVSVHGCVSRSQGGWVRCLAGGVVVDTASLLQCHLSLLSYLLLWQRRTCHLIHHGWLGRYSCIRWAQAICLDTPAFWFRRHLLCASLTGGVATVSAPADRPDRQQHNEWLMMQTVLSFCTVNTT